jgi:hypothetical protein
MSVAEILTDVRSLPVLRTDLCESPLKCQWWFVTAMSVVNSRVEGAGRAATKAIRHPS